jgi:hypothetical protein
MRRKTLFIVGLAVFLLLIINAGNALAYSINIDDEDKQIIDLEGNPMDPLLAPEWYYKPANYATLVEWYQAIEDMYPDYVEIFKANELYDTGTVYGGYDLYYVRITNENLGLHKPEVLFLGGPHGDETVGTIGFYWFTDWLFRMAFTDEIHEEFTKDYLQWILDNREIYIEVSHNPYGFDHGPQRYDGNSWDLNREADYDGPGSPTGGIWASVPGKTLVEFVNNHLIRTGCDIHGGVRMIIYPWADTHSDVTGISPITGESYRHAPPDFYFFDAAGLRFGNYMGDYGGDLNKNNIGTIYELITYSVKGGICPWAYAADVETNLVEDPYVQDEIYGNYPGAGILWYSPEMSVTKNPAEYTFGNDTVHRFGAEMRRYVMHQTDLAQPYVRWISDTVESGTEIKPETTVKFNWQVNGSLVVDHTYMQWGTHPDPINKPDFTTTDHDEFAGEYLGGTGWDDAESGSTNGVTYNESIYLETPGDYYFVAKAQVDQVYADVLRPDIYGDDPYSRVVKERTNDDYYEVLEGTDGTEVINGQTWWYSPIIQVTVINNPPERPERTDGEKKLKLGEEYSFTTSTTDADGDQVYYKWNWGDGSISEWDGPYESGETVESSHIWYEKGDYEITVKAKDIFDAESDWSQPDPVTVPRNKISINTIIMRLFEQFPNAFPIIRQLLGL